jgi:N utilization substance protein B
MFSRRNLRIKVMQTLYSALYQEDVSPNKLVQVVKQSIEQSNLLFLLNVYVLVRTTEFSIEDEQLQAGKHLLSAEQKKTSTSIYNNTSLLQIITQEVFITFKEKQKPENFIDDDLIRTLYQTLKKDPVYTQFVKDYDGQETHIKNILLYLYQNIIYPSETFDAVLEEKFPTWADEYSFILKRVETAIKTGKLELDDATLEDALEYGKKLFTISLENDVEFTNLIKPKLKNWDPERIAPIDMILMKMCLAELTYFPNIPIKVSINEYIDISKLYSTPKSKDFINGVVDKIKNELERDGKIKKSGRGLMVD